jgi:hypothetical protein
MKPVALVIGNILRLVGISSPEDAAAKPKSADDPPSWRDDSLKKPDSPAR